MAGSGWAERGWVVDGWAIGAGGGAVGEVRPWLVDLAGGAGAAEADGHAEWFGDPFGEEGFPEFLAE